MWRERRAAAAGGGGGGGGGVSGISQSKRNRIITHISTTGATHSTAITPMTPTVRMESLSNITP